MGRSRGRPTTQPPSPPRPQGLEPQNAAPSASGSGGLLCSGVFGRVDGIYRENAIFGTPWCLGEAEIGAKKAW